MSPRSATNPGRRTAASARRAPWGTISREQVVNAATQVVKKGGYEGMTIRSLAAELGVAPMSLYRHVRDKDDLLDEVVDRLLAKAWRPSASPSDWQSWVAEAAEDFGTFWSANQPPCTSTWSTPSFPLGDRTNEHHDRRAEHGHRRRSERPPSIRSHSHLHVGLCSSGSLPLPAGHLQTTKRTDEHSNSPPIPPLASSPKD